MADGRNAIPQRMAVANRISSAVPRPENCSARHRGGWLNDAGSRRLADSNCCIIPLASAQPCGSTLERRTSPDFVTPLGLDTTARETGTLPSPLAVLLPMSHRVSRAARRSAKPASRPGIVNRPYSIGGVTAPPPGLAIRLGRFLSFVASPTPRRSSRYSSACSPLSPCLPRR